MKTIGVMFRVVKSRQVVHPVLAVFPGKQWSARRGTLFGWTERDGMTEVDRRWVRERTQPATPREYASALAALKRKYADDTTEGETVRIKVVGARVG